MIPASGTPFSPGDSVLLARARFSREIVEEHIDEAAFLYTQWAVLRSDRALGWCDVERTEDRLKAHLDALRTCDDIEDGDLADAGRLYVLLRTFCRRDDFGRVRALLCSLATPSAGGPSASSGSAEAGGVPRQLPAPDDGSEIQDAGLGDHAGLMSAVYDALKLDFPAAWVRRLSELSVTTDPMLADSIWKVSGYRRWSPGPQGLAIPEHAMAGFCFHAGRVRDRAALMKLRQVISTGSPEAKQAAVIGVLRLGERSFLALLRDDAPIETWGAVGLALGGDVSAARRLASTPAMEPDVVLALGLLGSVESIEPLLEALADAKLAEMASIALDLITGAGLVETVFVPDEIEANEVLADETDGPHEDETPPSKDAPAGETVARLSRNPDDWRAWWAEHGSTMTRGVRWRRGKPYSPMALLDQLCDPRTPAFVRDFVVEEFAIRYGIDLAFEPDAPVSVQRPALERLRHNVAGRAARFPPGGWNIHPEVTEGGG